MTVGPFTTFPVDPVGPSYEHRSTSQSIQDSMNLIPEIESTGQSVKTANPWPGAKSWTTATGVDRGFGELAGVLYQVRNTTLYKIDSNMTETVIGNIEGANRCIFASDGTNLIITTGTKGYQYNGTTLTEITDSDYESGNSCAFLNSRIIFDGDGGRFQVADVGDPDSIQPNNFATAESAPDDTIRVYVFNQSLYLFGTKTVERWYNTNSGNPPFDRYQNGRMNVGLKAIHAVTESDQYVYWFGDDNMFYRISANQPTVISNKTISRLASKISDTSDCIAYSVVFEGSYYIIFTFPSGNKTLVFSEAVNDWFYISTGADEDRYIGNSAISIYDKTLIADKDSGNIYELDAETYDHGGTVAVYRRRLPPITSIVFGSDGQRILMDRFQVNMKTGVGTPTVVDPEIFIQYSLDGGDSLTNQTGVKIGRGVRS